MTFEAIMKQFTTLHPLSVNVVPFKKNIHDHILIEVAIFLMKHIKGDFNPEQIMITENAKRSLYTVMLPQPLVDILTKMDTPKNFPTFTGNDKATYHFVTWTAEKVRYWMSLSQPDGATNPPTSQLKMILEDSLEKKGLHILELKKNIRKTQDFRSLTGIHHVAIGIDEIWNPTTEDPTRSLEELKRVKIMGKYWTVALSNTITHKLNLCIECYHCLPIDHPSVITPFQHLEQQAGEDPTVSDKRLHDYLNTAFHESCRKKKRPTAVPAESGFQAMLAKRLKEEATQSELAEKAPKPTEEPTA